MSHSHGFFSSDASKSSIEKKFGPNVTHYGDVTLFDNTNQLVQVSVISSLSSIYVTTAIKHLGSIFFERPEASSGLSFLPPDYCVIRSFFNNTHNKSDTAKVHGIGSLLMECVVAHCLRNNLGLRVMASSSHIAYLKLGFSAIGKTWSFPEADHIHTAFRWGLALSSREQTVYEQQTAYIAQKTGKSPDLIKYEEVCQTDINEILTNCAKDNKAIPDAINGVMEMRLLKNGLNFWKQRILTSSLNHEPALIDNLQLEVMEESKNLPQAAQEIIKGYCR